MKLCSQRLQNSAKAVSVRRSPQLQHKAVNVVGPAAAQASLSSRPSLLRSCREW